MGHPALLLRFEPAPGVDRDIEGGGPGGEVGLGGDSEAVGEGGESSFRESEDVGVVGGDRVWGGVAEEAWVGVVEAFELGSDGQGEAIVDHEIWGWW